ncbi:MAG: metalloregulator ArsR/SmtB family transcription factor [Desulfobulbaceae bacterium]|nr:metalloregulator ArsR/SmtB family transcription factor [Desulfobulbaceae bacterium]
MEQLARFIKILGDTSRLSIIRAIGSDARSVSEIIKETGLSQTLVSFHLRNLRNSGIVQTRREGPFIYYNLLDPKLLILLDQLALMTGLEDNPFNAERPAQPRKIQARGR